MILFDLFLLHFFLFLNLINLLKLLLFPQQILLKAVPLLDPHRYRTVIPLFSQIFYNIVYLAAALDLCFGLIDMYLLVEVLILRCVVAQGCSTYCDDAGSHARVIYTSEAPFVAVEDVVDTEDAAFAQDVQGLLFLVAVSHYDVDDALGDDVDVAAGIAAVEEKLVLFDDDVVAPVV